MPFNATIDKTDVSLDELNELIDVLNAAGLSVQGIKSALEADDRLAALAGLLQQEPAFPCRWSKPTLHAYQYEEGSMKWPALAEIEADNLTYQICADCGNHVWVKVRGLKAHLSKRTRVFVQITPGLQVKPTAQGLLVRRPQAVRGATHCRYACD